MLRRDPNYRRVAAGFNFAGRSSCWLAADHLLVVEQQFVAEEYRRFSLTDVQTLLLRRTLPGRIGAWLLGGSTLLFGALGGGFAVNLVPNSGDTPAVFFGGITALLGTSLLIHLALGPTAALELRTAVQTYRVPGVSRWRKGLKVFNALTAAASAAQNRIAEPGLEPGPEPAPEIPAA